MKILALSDIDDFHWKYGAGQADVVLSCGDVSDQVILEAAQAYVCPKFLLEKQLTSANYDTIVSLIMKTELVTTLKRRATRLISEIRKKHAPILITEYGKPAAYLVDVESFETQQARIRILEGIARGENAIQAGRILTNEQARKRMKRWLA